MDLPSLSDGLGRALEPQTGPGGGRDVVGGDEMFCPDPEILLDAGGISTGPSGQLARGAVILVTAHPLARSWALLPVGTWQIAISGPNLISAVDRSATQSCPPNPSGKVFICSYPSESSGNSATLLKFARSLLARLAHG